MFFYQVMNGSRYDTRAFKPTDPDPTFMWYKMSKISVFSDHFLELDFIIIKKCFRNTHLNQTKFDNIGQILIRLKNGGSGSDWSDGSGSLVAL